MSTPTPEAYEAAATADGMHDLIQRSWGLDLGECHCARNPNLRAAVDAVWPIARATVLAEVGHVEAASTLNEEETR